MNGNNFENNMIESSATKLPTEYGTFTVSAFGFPNSNNHLFLVYGTIEKNDIPLVRVHSECLTGEVFGSKKCDCKSQLIESINLIKAEGKGIIIYLRQEGRGIGLFNKIEAYKLQEEGFDTITANMHLNLEVDSRDYYNAYLILHKKGVDKIRLITNNSEKIKQLEGYGIVITAVVHTKMHMTGENQHYINTKIAKLNHTFIIND